MQLFAQNGSHAPDRIQRFSMFLMSLLVLLTFVGTNMQALLWQSSDWLVSTVLPAVVIDLTNDERSDNSRTELTRNTVLDQAAAAKAKHMADNEYFAHFAPDGTTPWQFFSEADYVYAHAGENLAIHFTDSAEVVEAWMLSPAHRKNIVDPKFTEIGVGTARGTFDGYDTVYVVQLFGTPAESNAARTAAATPIEPVDTARTASGPEVPSGDEFSSEPGELPEAVTTTPVASSETIQEPVPVEVLPAADDSKLPIDTQVAAETETATTAVVQLPTTNLSDTLPLPETEVAARETNAGPELFPEQPELTASMANDVVVIRTELSTSSGLAVATMIDASTTHAGATIASIATRPNLVLQSLYVLLATIIVISLGYSLVMEARRMHYVQVAYSLALMLVMGGLWFLHTALTSGAVIV